MGDLLGLDVAFDAKQDRDQYEREDMKFASAVCMMVVAACSPSRDSGRSAASLGIERVSITESATDRTIVGFDDEGREVAKVRIHHGAVVMPEDERTVDGHELLVTLRGEMAVRYVNEGTLTTATVPVLDPEGLGERERFLEDERVVAALAHWGVTFTERQLAAEGDEQPYGACTYSRCTGSGNYELQCCQSGNTQYVTCNTLGPGVLNERGCGNAPTCSGGGTYGTGGCPSGQTANCGGGNFQNSSNPRLCMANACPAIAVGPAGCAVCAQTAAGTGNWWNIADYGSSCGPTTCRQDGYSCYMSSECCGGACVNGTCGASISSCDAQGFWCMNHCGGVYQPYVECQLCYDVGTTQACYNLGRPMPTEQYCGDSICTGWEASSWEPRQCLWDCGYVYGCPEWQYDACASICPYGLEDAGCDVYQYYLCMYENHCFP